MLKFTKTNHENDVRVTVTNQTFIRFGLFVIGLFVLLFVVKRASHALLLIFTAFFFALALNSPVYWLSARLPGKRKGSRSIATTLSFLVVVIALGIFLASIVPPLVRQTDSFIHNAPHLIKEYKNQNSPVGKFIRHYHLQKVVTDLSTQLSARINHAGGTAFSTVKHVGSSIFSLLTILVLTFMMLVEGPRWVRFVKDVVPDKHSEMYDKLTKDMYEVIRGFVNGQIILASLAAVVISPMLIFLHISYVAALFVIIFVCGLIPMVGHTIGAVIITLVAVFHSTSSALIILIYYILYMQIEAYIIQPRIQANTTKMSPLLVFMSLVIGLSFGGLLGGLVAIPIGGCFRIAILEFFYSKKIIDLPEPVAQRIKEDTK